MIYYTRVYIFCTEVDDKFFLRQTKYGLPEFLAKAGKLWGELSEHVEESANRSHGENKQKPTWQGWFFRTEKMAELSSQTSQFLGVAGPNFGFF